MTLNLNPTQNPLPVPVVSATGEGVMTPEMLAQLESAATLTDVTIYLDPMGSDSNDGLTPETALLTPQAAWLKLTSLTRFGFGRIDAAPGTYLMDATSLEDGGYVNGAQAKSAGSPPFWVGKFTNEVGTRTTTSASATGIAYIDSTLAMTANQYQGLWVQCISAANPENVGFRSQIASNSATTLTLSVPLPAAISIGDTFEIQQPSVIFQLQSAIIFGYGNNYVGFQGINFDFNSQAIIFTDGVKGATDGVIFDAGFSALLIFQGAWIKTALDGPWSIDSDGGPVPPAAAGALFRNILIVFGDANVLYGTHAFDNGVLLPNEGNGPGSVTLNNIVSTNFGFAASFGGFLQIVDGTMGVASIIISGQDPLSIWPAQANITMGSSGDLEVYKAINCSGPAVQVTRGSYAYCEALTGGAGDGNADVGLDVEQMSTMSAPGCTVAGTVGATRIGGAVTAYGSLPFTNGSTLCRIED